MHIKKTLYILAYDINLRIIINYPLVLSRLYYHLMTRDTSISILSVHAAFTK